MQAQLAERTKELLGIPESLPEFGAAPDVSTGDLPPRARPEVSPESDVLAGTAPDAAFPPGGEGAPREEPPPGEERPERRGEAPTTPPSPREEPPAGEERPGRRTP